MSNRCSRTGCVRSGGDASQTGAVGSKLYSGAGQKAVRDSFHNQRETLATLAADTGGKALLD